MDKEEIIDTAKEAAKEAVKTSLWNKRADELTVGESVKLSLLVPVVLIGGMLVVAGTAAAKDGIKSKLEKRKHRKIEEELRTITKIEHS